MGQSYLQKKEYDRAIAYFNRAIALDQNSFLAHISLADTYFITEKLELSLDEYGVALQLSERDNSSEQEKKYIKDRIDVLYRKKGLRN